MYFKPILIIYVLSIHCIIFSLTSHSEEIERNSSVFVLKKEKCFMWANWSRKKVLPAFLCEHLFPVPASHEINSLIFGNVQEADGRHNCFHDLVVIFFFLLQNCSCTQIAWISSLNFNLWMNMHFKLNNVNETEHHFYNFFLLCAQKKQQKHSWICLHTPKCTVE